jgi:hypothetical protein
MTQAFNLSQLANNVDTSGLLDASVGLANAVPIANGGTGSTSASSAKIALEVITGTTKSEILPVGTTLQRDSSPAVGYIRYNTDYQTFEGYSAGGWGSIGAGAKGGGNNQVFFENDTNVTVDYTITSGKNAMTAGPVTINTGVSVTVPTGSTWIIV